MFPGGPPTGRGVFGPGPAPIGGAPGRRGTRPAVWTVWTDLVGLLVGSFLDLATKWSSPRLTGFFLGVRERVRIDSPATELPPPRGDGRAGFFLWDCGS